jgi:hypothetical protein
MAADKKIRFGIEGGEQVDAYMQRYRQFAEQQAQQIVDYAKRTEGSGKAQLKNIEDQVATIEKRNKLEEQYRKSQIKVGTASGAVTDPSKALEAAAKVTEEDKLSVQLLKEILDTEKISLREQIKQERQGAADKQDQEKSENEELRRRQKTQDDEESQARSARRGVVQAGAGVGLSKNEFYGAAGLLAFIPLFGQALAAGAQKALSSAEAYQAGLGANVGIGGGTQGRLAGYGAGQTVYGYSIPEALQERVSIARARGGVDGAGQAALESQILQRGAGLDQSTILGLERLQRGGDVGSSTSTVQSLVAGLKSTGAMGGSDLAALPEYLQILTSLGQEQISTLGKIDMGVNQKLVVGLSTLDDSFKNPDVLRTVIESVKGGLSGATTPQMEALQYSVLSRMNPGSSFVELQEMREVPSLEYFQAMMEQLRGMSANEEQLVLNVQAAFGGKIGMARKIAEGKITDVDFTGKGIKDLKGRGRGATPELTKSEKEFENTFALTGDKLVKAISGFGTSLQQAAARDKERTQAIDDNTVELLKQNGNETAPLKKEFYRAMILLSQKMRTGRMHP